MRLSLSTATVFALSAAPLVASLGVSNCGGANSDLTRSCYTCPVIKYFNVGIFNWDTVSRICFGYSTAFSDTRMACTYYEAGYKWTEKWWGGSADRWQKPRLVGRCYFSEDGNLLTSGRYAGYSSSECPRKAYRENDSECAREKDKGAYYKCAQPGCAYETPMCYGCPRLSSDFVNVSSTNSSLTCGYSSNGRITNTCTFDGTDGRIVSNTSNSPRCPVTATLATACERSRQERLRIEAAKIAAAKKAAFIKSTYTDKGAIAVDCAEFLTEKARIRRGYVPPASFDQPRGPIPGGNRRYRRPRPYISRGSRTNRVLLQERCDNPQLFATIDTAESSALGGKYKEFVDDMKAMVKTEYGTFFVMLAEAKMKLEEALKTCQKKLYDDDKSLNGNSYSAPPDEQVDIDFVRLPVLPEECLDVDDPSDDDDDDSSDDDDDDDPEDASDKA
ncbi:hypothetical protein H0H81_002014 [Sphagnurus paluster]|uniref:Uncharacterized protein n=1 Tax=Sphagnurus paluster TaxID=117069 RepID=A0A9P7GMT3_9AGAR|nr:hypothetical protein H0H81_002014 [Sphagnurus paluster]